MVCRNCKKEYSNNFEYCPYCAEPKVVKTQMVRSYHHWGNAGFEIMIGVAVLIFFVFGYAVFYNAVKSDGADIADSDVLGTFLKLYIPLQIVHIIGVVAKYKNKKNRIIMEQHHYDKTSICPKCGSHNIKIYREGYNYTKGFWLRMFDVKGSGYVAGMNSNRARCRCMNCGMDWATEYDYRFIDK